MATRVSTFGAWMSAISPHSNRVLSRSSRCGIRAGLLSEVIAIWWPRLVELVERVEELFLSLFLAGDELDVIDQQCVGRAIARPEVVHGPALDGGDQLIGKGLGADIEDQQVAVDEMVAEGLQQMGLAEARCTVEEERIVAITRSIGGAAARCGRQLIAFADDEAVEGVALSQPRPGDHLDELRVDRAGQHGRRLDIVESEGFEGDIHRAPGNLAE